MNKISLQSTDHIGDKRPPLAKQAAIMKQVGQLIARAQKSLDLLDHLREQLLIRWSCETVEEYEGVVRNEPEYRLGRLRPKNTRAVRANRQLKAIEAWRKEDG